MARSCQGEQAMGPTIDGKLSEADGKRAMAQALFMKGDLERAFYIAVECYQSYQAVLEQKPERAHADRALWGMGQSLNVMGIVSNETNQFEQVSVIFLFDVL